MTLYVILIFAVGSVIELYGLLWLSSIIGFLNVVNLIMFSFLIGVVVGRAYDRTWFNKMQWHLKSGTMPNEEILDGAVMNLASMALMTPGIILDTIALFVLIPPTRGLFKDMALSLTQKKISSGQVFFFFKDPDQSNN